MNNYLRGIFFVVSLLGSVLLSAQNESEKKDKSPFAEAALPRYTWKINLLSPLDIYRHSLSFRTDVRLSKRFVAEGSVGWFFYGSDVRYNEETYSGIRLRAGVKYFIPNYIITPSGLVRHYFGIEGKYNFIKEQNFETVCRYGCQYQQAMLLSYTQEISGIALKGGAYIYWGKKNNWFLELNSGLGFRVVNLSHGLLPDDAEILRNRDWFLDRLGRNVTADFLCGMHLGYCFY